jgi:hypothetical protein
MDVHAIGRRRLLAGLGGLAVAGGLGACDTGGRNAASTSGSASASTSSPVSTLQPSNPSASASATASAAVAALPATRPWVPTSAEIDPWVKVRAVRLLEAIGAWPQGQSGLTAARRRVAALGYDPALADQADSLLGTGRSAAIQVVDAQYGGILSASSSVMVILRQWVIGTDGLLTERGTTVDTRLVAASPNWRVIALHPAAPGSPAASLSSLADAVLADTRIHLPYAAHADIRSGEISVGVLTAIRKLAEHHVVDVSVVKSGHPYYVFGTNRVSDHPRGHAVDIWAIDGLPAVNPANRSLVESVIRAGITYGAWQVGGPYLLGPGPTYFSDNTHHDHVHWGFHF